MPTFFAPLLVAVSALSAPALEPGTMLTYRGQIVAVKEEGPATRKSFELQLVAAEGAEGSTVLIWAISEQGRGGWPWTDQFGRASLDARLRGPAGDGPSLLYERDDGKAVIPILLPLFVAPQPLAKDAAWSEAGLDYRVEGPIRTAAGRDAWQVTARNRIGRKRTLLVDTSSPLVANLAEVVFMGQGQEHSLTYELIKEEKLAAAPLKQLASAQAALTALRGKVLKEARVPEVDWKPEQLAVLRQELPAVATLASTTLLERVAGLAELDVRFQKGRSGAVTALKAGSLGKEVPAFELETSDGEKLAAAGLRGQVTVLHFWDYRDPPVEAPYGQVGYLDFLSRRQKEAGLKVYGVAVRSELGDAAKRRAIGQNVRKFREFMNLSYPVLLDNGAVLKLLGDPRETGAKLPLFVVVGRDGKIAEYHVGAYETGRDQGLTQLDAAVRTALDRK